VAAKEVQTLPDGTLPDAPDHPVWVILDREEIVRISMSGQAPKTCSASPGTSLTHSATAVPLWPTEIYSPLV
jgi:hypothetical protein